MVQLHWLDSELENEQVALPTQSLFCWHKTLSFVFTIPFHIRVHLIILLCLSLNCKTSGYLQAIRQCPNTVGTPPICLILYLDYRASVNPILFISNLGSRNNHQNWVANQQKCFGRDIFTSKKLKLQGRGWWPFYAIKHM